MSELSSMWLGTLEAWSACVVLLFGWLVSRIIWRSEGDSRSLDRWLWLAWVGLLAVGVFLVPDR